MKHGMGKREEQSVYMKIFILYSVAHFIYVIKIWRNGGSKLKNSLNSTSKEVVLQVIKHGEFSFILFFNSFVIP